MAWHRIAITLAIVVVGCGPTPPEPPKIRVAAASDLQEALPILAAAFRQEHGIEVVPVFGASGQLSEQIRQGAPFDVFLSANREFVDRLADRGIVRPGSVRPYTRGVLALAVNKLSATRVQSLDDLSSPLVRKIAIANPDTAPYGIAARQALERAGLWGFLQPKLVPAESVRQALQFVRSGNAEVAFVGRSIGEVREVTMVALPLDACDPIIQHLGVVADSKQPAEAERFVDFLLSEIGQGMLVDLGFRPVPPARRPHGEPRSKPVD